MPPRPSPEAVQQARTLIGQPAAYAHIPRGDWLDLTTTAWTILCNDRSHRRARAAIRAVNGGDAA